MPLFTASTLHGVDSHFLPTTPRQVMEDIAQWWILVLLRDGNVNRVHEVMESILPGLLPLATQEKLATQLKILSLWQEVLLNTHLEGDFEMLQDKFLLLLRVFGKCERSSRCMQLLKVHEIVAEFYGLLLVGKSPIDELQRSLEAVYLEKEIPSELLVLLKHSENTLSLQVEVEKIVAPHINRNVSTEISSMSTDLSYSSLRDQMQAMLIQWIETSYETPVLIRLGYRISSEPISTTTSDVPHFISAPMEGRVHDSTSSAKIASTRRTPAEKDREMMRSTPSNDEEKEEEGVPGTSEPERLAHTHTQQQQQSESHILPEGASEAATVPTRPTDKLPSTRGGSVDSEMTAEASNPESAGVSVNENDGDFDDDGGIGKTMISSTRRRRSKCEKEQNPFSQEQLPSMTRPEVMQRQTPSKTIHSLSSDDDEEEEAIIEVRRQKKRRYSNPLSPLPNLQTSEMKRKMRARWVDAMEENWSSSSLGEQPMSGPRRFVQSVVPPNRGRYVQSSHGQVRPKPPLGVDPTHEERLRIAALALADGRKRIPFSEKENSAIQQGVRLYGDDWAAIKKHFVETFHSRTILHIKDRARVLIKKRKLDPFLIGHVESMEV